MPESTPVPVSPTEHTALVEAAQRALAARDQSGKSGIAAAILRDGQTIAEAENEVHLQGDPTRHAEMVAIARAAEVLGTTDLKGCVMISTLQPCEMCLAAMRFAGIRRVIFAATQGRVAAKYFAFPHLSLDDFRHGDDFDAIGGVCEDLVLHLYATGEE
ncbi:nucleoside deaminase [Pseudotabrizicola formosa]|uniref:nucleoside deaminase n=1 Tax=Pseudotabrizicola formosa TaxID=2030009 RepID=UPI00143CFD9D|nr:nucleoside deaminase [Pseudotabrizicola formosa]